MPASAAGRTDCRLDFDIKAAVTPELLGALAALGVHRADTGRGEAAARAARSQFVRLDVSPRGGPKGRE